MPGVLIGFHDESTQIVADGVTVHGEITVLVLAMNERQAGEHVGGAEPDEFCRRHIRRVTQGFAQLFAGARICPIGADDQIKIGQFFQARYEVAETHLNPHLGGAVL